MDDYIVDELLSDVGSSGIYRMERTKGTSKAHSPLSSNLINFRHNGENIDSYYKDEKIIKNHSNNYIYRSKEICNDNDQSGSSSLSIHTSSK